MYHVIIYCSTVNITLSVTGNYINIILHCLVIYNTCVFVYYSYYYCLNNFISVHDSIALKGSIYEISIIPSNTDSCVGYDVGVTLILVSVTRFVVLYMYILYVRIVYTVDYNQLPTEI